MKTIQLKDAKAKLSAVVDDAVAGEPTIITRHGKKQAVVLSFEEYEQRTKKPSLGELLLAYPGEPDDIPDRFPSPFRDVDL